MTFIGPDKGVTCEAMQNPQIGDEFTEMYTFFFFVIARDGDNITLMEAPPARPCELPRDGIVIQLSLDDFKKRFAYDRDPEKGYWVHLCKRECNVDGWLQYHQGALR